MKAKRSSLAIIILSFVVLICIFRLYIQSIEIVELKEMASRERESYVEEIENVNSQLIDAEIRSTLKFDSLKTELAFCKGKRGEN